MNGNVRHAAALPHSIMGPLRHDASCSWITVSCHFSPVQINKEARNPVTKAAPPCNTLVCDPV